MAKKPKLQVEVTPTEAPGLAPAWLPEVYRPVLEKLAEEFPVLAASTSAAKFKVAEAVATERWDKPVYPGIAIAPTGRVVANTRMAPDSLALRLRYLDIDGTEDDIEFTREVPISTPWKVSPDGRSVMMKKNYAVMDLSLDTGEGRMAWSPEEGGWMHSYGWIGTERLVVFPSVQETGKKPRSDARLLRRVPGDGPWEEVARVEKVPTDRVRVVDPFIFLATEKGKSVTVLAASEDRLEKLGRFPCSPELFRGLDSYEKDLVSYHEGTTVRLDGLWDCYEAWFD